MVTLTQTQTQTSSVNMPLLLLDITAATFFFRIKSVVDFDAGTKEYPLTIQVSDGANSIDITGTVILNGINEHATTFGGASEFQYS